MGDPYEYNFIRKNVSKQSIFPTLVHLADNYSRDNRWITDEPEILENLDGSVNLKVRMVRYPMEQFINLDYEDNFIKLVPEMKLEEVLRQFSESHSSQDGWVLNDPIIFRVEDSSYIMVIIHMKRLDSRLR